MGLFGKSGGKRGRTPTYYMMGGVQIKCPVCGNEMFLQGQAQLNTAVMTLVDLDWANKSATTLACSRCTYILWFGGDPTPTAGVD